MLLIKKYDENTIIASLFISFHYNILYIFNSSSGYNMSK